MSIAKEKKTYPTIREVKLLTKDTLFDVKGIVTKFNRRKDRNDNPFWNIMIADTSGELEGKIWSNSSWRKWTERGWNTFNPVSDELPKFEGASVGLRGKVVEYRDQLQYNFTDVFYLDQEKDPPHFFVRRTPLSDQQMQSELRKLIDATNEPVKSFLDHVFSRLAAKFETLPAAVLHHHAYVGGLMEHSLSVAANAKLLAQHYIDVGIENDINLDVVIAGALLHDIGKIDAYLLTPAPQMTLDGIVIDHIALGYHKFMTLAEQENLPRDISCAVAHIIISHHGRREYGSPVLPSTREAMIVAASDNLDFQIAAWHKQFDDMGNNAMFTEYIPVLERRLWRGTVNADEAPDAYSEEFTSQDAE